jgi:DNA polymerase III subunit delta'
LFSWYKSKFLDKNQIKTDTQVLQCRFSAIFAKMQFKEIIGQEQVRQRLIASVMENRVSHAQLFLGPPGSGNLALSLAYIQYIGCANKSESDSCGRCNSCNKFSKMIHPDVHFTYPVAGLKEVKNPVSVNFAAQWREAVTENPYLNLQQWYDTIGMENKQGFISVNESADIIKGLSLKSFESEYKFVVIWMPEKMRTDAANKLLKMIEEPPQKTLFILVAEDEEQIISTIRSRTQLIKIKRLLDIELSHALVQRHNVERTKAEMIAHLSQGDYNAAQSLISEEADNSSVDSFIAWMRLCYKLPLKELTGWIDDMAKAGRENQKNFLYYATHMARECLIINFAGEGITRMEESQLTALRPFARRINFNNSFLFVDELNRAHYHIERNGNPKIIFMDLSIKMNSLIGAN